MKVQVLENILVYVMICSWRILCGTEICGVKEGWEIVDEIQGRFCRKVIPSPRNAANGLVEW